MARIDVGERLLKHSRLDPITGCRMWTGATNHRGYGLMRVDGRHRAAHRVSYEIANGVRIPDGILACHRCDTPGCIEPGHLFLGTNADNTADMRAKGRARFITPRCLGEDHGNSKLTADKVRSIRADTRLNRIIAAEIGVNASAIGKSSGENAGLTSNNTPAGP